VTVLVALPIVPLLAALWFALTGADGRQRRAEGWVCALVALFPVAAATFVAPEQFEIRHLLTTEQSSLRIDGAARASLLLFGSLWLVAGLLGRSRSTGASAVPLLTALSGAVMVAVAESGPAVFTGMLVTGYGLYAVMASETGDSWRLASRTLVILLVVSDLVIFEILLHAAAHPLAGIGAGSAMLIICAIVLRGGIAPAHVWLPPALPGVSVPTALLLAGIPAGVALVGGQKLLAGAGTETGGFALSIGLAAALWSAIAGGAQRGALPTLAYATSASAALLLVALPLGTTAGSSPWLVLSLLACCSAAVIVGVLHQGPARSGAIVAILAVHGLAAGQAALLAAQRLSATGAFLASLIAVLSSLLLTLAVCRTPEHPRQGDSGEAAVHALALAALAALGLGYAWASDGIAFASLWPAPIGISLGLILFRLLPERETPRIPPGDILMPAAAAGGRMVRLLGRLCTRHLPRYRDRAQRAVVSLWRGERWAERIARLEARLGAWPATSVLMLLIAIVAALLLAS